MSIGILFFLSSGLFLGWSLGANDAANVFGTAVGSRMVRFMTAAVVCSIFVTLGAVFAGAGAAHTLGRLGAVNALAGSFTVALAAAMATFVMTRLGLPISTSQAVVGAIIGWNLYAQMITDTTALGNILLSWVLCPILAAVIAVLLYQVMRFVLVRSQVHLLRQDAMVRAGLLTVGAFGSFSLGANNVANVMGVFLPDNPFTDLQVLGVTITGSQQLFMVGGLAIATGVLTYSDRVMRTVGGGIMRLTPEAAFVVVLAHGLVLFLFASEGLEGWLARHGLPTVPLVPVSSSQAVIGAIVGIGLLHGRRHLRLRSLGAVGLGWVITPVVAGTASFVMLFFVDNVFDQAVVHPLHYRIDQDVIDQARAEGMPTEGLTGLLGYETTNAMRLRDELDDETALDRGQVRRVIARAEMMPIRVDLGRADLDLDPDWFAADQLRALRGLAGRRFDHAWQFHDALATASPLWRLREDIPLNRSWNEEIRQKLAYLDHTFQASTDQP